MLLFSPSAKRAPSECQVTFQYTCVGLFWKFSYQGSWVLRFRHVQKWWVLAEGAKIRRMISTEVLINDTGKRGGKTKQWDYFQACSDVFQLQMLELRQATLHFCQPVQVELKLKQGKHGICSQTCSLLPLSVLTGGHNDRIYSTT